MLLCKAEFLSIIIIIMELIEFLEINPIENHTYSKPNVSDGFVPTFQANAETTSDGPRLTFVPDSLFTFFN